MWPKGGLRAKWSLTLKTKSCFSLGLEIDMIVFFPISFVNADTKGISQCQKSDMLSTRKKTVKLIAADLERFEGMTLQN